ncbi:selenide, water dikinase SelD [Clostridium cylindrosporum DSM 605]|uniref:Selenide, water dikinase n=1 Tax=Clostridium cylindrosporum DSM 605 TaxID=1121307 RepID=A0A0J8DBA2_CLOCY|nr:selenide, water dikinase SelD [Clostridium cylindrosporum DSM 605]
MCKLPKVSDENLLVGIDTSDDAAVYKINDETAVIQTLDFFTPIVDDPYMFGQIAATNSLSDIYAMGGTPTLALNIVCFPNCLDIEILGEILRGGADKVKEAGAIIVGGHTVSDNEPKYGLSVMGLVHPEKVFANSNAKPGEVLIITKPIGTGVINTAIKGEIASKEHIDEAMKYMSTLNKYASDIARKYNISSCTDITGFGLAGHVYEMAKGGNLSITIESDKVPFMNGAEEYAKMAMIPAGTYNNRNHVGKNYESLVKDAYIEDLMFDPQTSGGLLYTLKEEEAIKLADELKENNIIANIIGFVEEKKEKYVYIK